MQISFAEAVNLRGKKQRVVYKVGDGSIIKLFDRTPIPTKPTDVVCPHFLELKWANGCFFDCAWCYLNGTYRFHPNWKNGEPNIKEFGKIESHLSLLLSNDGFRPEILNAGELSDSLIAERREGKNPPFSSLITRTLSDYDPKGKHKVLFLTKSTNVRNLLRLGKEGSRRIIMSFTLNADLVAKKWEKKAPSVSSRIRAARMLEDAGYRIRIRIDPIVPIDSSEEYYGKLVDEIFKNFRPERITLGSLRGLNTTITNARDKSWIGYLTEKSNWGRKVDFNSRHHNYAFLIKRLRKEYGFKDVALCKETVEMWERLSLDYTKIKCNCVS
jgi:spore photoproduct lyase